MSGATSRRLAGPARRWRTLLLRLLVPATSILVALLVGELATRLFVPPERWRLRDSGADWQADPVLGWTPKPNLDVATQTDDGSWVRLRTNGDGVSPAEARRARAAGRLRILLFGDSAVAGTGVREEERIHSWLESKLRRRGVEAEAINAGVDGYSTDQVLLRMRRLIALYRPDVVTYCYSHNDLGGIGESTAYGFGKPRFALRDGSLVLFPPSGRLPQERRLPLAPRELVQRIAVYRLLRPAIVHWRAKLGSWNTRVLTEPAPALLFDPAELERADWPLFAALVGAMRAAAEDHGTAFVMYPHPDIAEVWDPFIVADARRNGRTLRDFDRYALQRRLRRVAATAGSRYCSTTERFVAEQSRGPFHLLPRDPHCNGKGYELTAEVLASCLIERRHDARRSGDG